MLINEKDNIKISPSSYWMASTPESNYPVLKEDINVDVLIIGGGMVGITIAYLLKKEGVKIAVLEADHIAQGTSAHTTAKITSQHNLIYGKIKNEMSEDLAKQYATANETAIKEIKKIIDENNILCDYVSQSAFVYTEQEEEVKNIEEEVKVASALGIKASYKNNIPFPIDIKGAVCFENQAQFHPRKYLLALAKCTHSENCQIFEESRAVDIEDGENYIVTTSNGKKVSAEKLIIASHYPFYNKHGGYFTRIYPESSYVIAVKTQEKYPGGMYINCEEPSRSLRYQNTEDGDLILVGGNKHKAGQGNDTINHYKDLIKFANNIFTVEDIPYIWSTQDCMTMDGLPYVGHFTSNTPNMYIATGFCKWGMTNSMASAMILKDLIIKGESPYEEVYNPSRKTIKASAKSFLVENFNVAEKLLKSKLSPVTSNFDIALGEGKVLELNGKRVGVYRDEEGSLHIVNTTCPHMGCELNWNPAEKSWDCPCHGSRFSYDGKIIEGPAVKPLTEGYDVNAIEKLFKEDY